jgi:aminoglycoside phosphotransferase (APT) family kinase protein
MGTTDVDTTFDLARLDSYMARALTGDQAGKVERSLISGGLSQMTVRYTAQGATASASAADADVVVRVPPAFGPLEPYEPVTEARLLQAMSELGRPVPQVCLIEDDPRRLGRAFYATSFIPATMTAEGGARVGVDGSRLAESFIDLLLSIHRAPLETPTAAGTLREILGHLPEKTPQGVLDRWDGPLEAAGVSTPTYHRFLGEWLRLRRPAPSGLQTVVHGDFRLGNVLWRPDGEVAAMMDWEETALGDPLYDLAWLLVGSYADDDMIFELAPRSWFIARYAERSGVTVDPARLLWWEVAAGWSLLAMNAVALGFMAQGRYHDIRPMLYGYLNRRIARVLLRKVRAYEDMAGR